METGKLFKEHVTWREHLQSWWLVPIAEYSCEAYKLRTGLDFPEVLIQNFPSLCCIKHSLHSLNFLCNIRSLMSYRCYCVTHVLCLIYFIYYYCLTCVIFVKIWKNYYFAWYFLFKIPSLLCLVKQHYKVMPQILETFFTCWHPFVITQYKCVFWVRFFKWHSISNGPSEYPDITHICRVIKGLYFHTKHKCKTLRTFGTVQEIQTAFFSIHPVYFIPLILIIHAQLYVQCAAQ